MHQTAPQSAVDTDAQPDAAAIREAFLAAGLDPDIIPLSRAAHQDATRPLADVLEDQLIAEVIADDLTDKEAKLFASAFWTGAHSKNVERARSVWRIVTFLLKYPTAAPDDIPPRLLTDTFYATYRKPRTTLSSLTHAWSKMQAFSLARDRLNAYPLHRWSQHRRSQMEVICEWERQICERSEARRKDRLVKKLKGRS